jgi:hypothetical protein
MVRPGPRTIRSGVIFAQIVLAHVHSGSVAGGLVFKVLQIGLS